MGVVVSDPVVAVIIVADVEEAEGPEENVIGSGVGGEESVAPEVEPTPLGPKAVSSRS